MNVRDYARSIIEADTLEGKLAPPPGDLDDSRPGPPLRIDAPARPARLAIAHRIKVPPPQGMSDPAQRARIVHALANHELQAAELFAWALLAFPEAPAPFRRGLLGILADEQRHCRLYMACMEAHGVHLGDYPVTGHFWNKLAPVTTPLAFVCTMGLTFENANLDFAAQYARGAEDAGDLALARALAQVHADEVRHVHFAWRWLTQLKPAAQSPWEAYLATVEWPLGPARARGKDFDTDSRRAAGLDDEFIAHLAATDPKRPGGGPR